MEQRSREHIETAQRHQRLAQGLLDPSAGSLLPDGKYEWATVMAFYAAAHYIQAYLWERHRFALRSHAARAQRVRHDPVLKQCERAYRQLLDESDKSRYQRLHVVTESLAQELVEVDLAHVEATVMAAI